MINLVDFKNFFREINDRYKKIMDEFLSKESKILSDIIDMTREWEDEGVRFSYDIEMSIGDRMAIKLEGIRGDDIILSEIIRRESDLIRLSELIEKVEDLSKEINVSINFSGSKRAECLSSLVGRINLAYPDMIFEMSSYNISIKL